MIEKQAEKRWVGIFSRPFRGWAIFGSLLFLYSAWLIFRYGWTNFSPAIGCRWDCGWYESIAENGYVSSLPPTAQDLKHSNVAFFPFYPGLGALLGAALGFPLRIALPVVSIFFALGLFSIVSLLILERGQSMFRILFMASYPATFYLFVGYSESTYVFLLLAGVYLIVFGERFDNVVRICGLALSGFALGLTRLTGFLVPFGLFAVLFAAIALGKTQLRKSFVLPATIWMGASLGGVLAFFAYCHFHFGAWDLYFQTLDVGWKKEPSAVGFVVLFFKGLGKSLLGPWFAREPTWMSSMINSDLIVLLGYVLFREGRRILALDSSVIKERDLIRYGLLCGLAGHLFVTTFGDSGNEHRWGNGMRYSLPVFYLLVILWDELWWPEVLRKSPEWLQRIRIALLALGLPFQLYYLYLFTTTRWVS